MSIMQKQRARDPRAGYARDFVTQVEESLDLLSERGTRVITNAGGVNPLACRGALLELAQLHGKPLEVAAVIGDDLLDRLGELNAAGAALDNMEDGAPFAAIRDRVSSANAYYGAWPVVEALKSGAQLVVTGRCTDTGITLAPMIHAFEWAPDDWDRLAAGIVAGHIVECGAQCTGGNFTDWHRVPRFGEIGYPVIEVSADGIVRRHQARRHRRRRHGAHGEGAAGLRDGRSARLPHPRRGGGLRQHPARAGGTRSSARVGRARTSRARLAQGERLLLRRLEGERHAHPLGPGGGGEGSGVREALLAAARARLRGVPRGDGRPLLVLGTIGAAGRSARGAAAALGARSRPLEDRAVLEARAGGDPLGPAGRRRHRRPTAGAGSGGVLAGARAPRRGEAAARHARRRAHAGVADAARAHEEARAAAALRGAASRREASSSSRPRSARSRTRGAATRATRATSA